MTLRNAFDAVATETTLAALNTKAATAIVDMPGQDTPALPVRNAPQKYTDISFSQVGTGLLAPEMALIRTGAGQTVNQSGGNLVITAGTTATAETVIRSVATFNGALTFKSVTTLSQRILQNFFALELVDVIGDGLAYTIVNATTVDVTKVAHGFTAQNVGQTIDMVALSSVGVPSQGVIASIPNTDTIRFTVAGWPASGSGTLSLTGWNKIEAVHSTNNISAVFNTRRRGWQNTAITINTGATSAPGLMVSITQDNGVVSFADELTTSVGVMTNRGAWRTNVPLPDVDLYIQLRATNGSTAPASTTTWTLGMLRVEDYIPQQVSITATRQQSLHASLPVSVISTVSTAVTGTVTATVGSATLSIPVAQTDVASAALTTTTTTAAITPSFGLSYSVLINVTAVTGTSPTLSVVIEESDDSGTNWFPVYEFAQIGVAGTYRSPKMPFRGNRVRYVQTVTGTTPSFTRSIVRLQHQSSVEDLRQIFDRSRNSAQALNDLTGTLLMGACRNVQMVISSGAIGTAPAFQLEAQDGGGQFYALGAPLTAVAASAVRVTVNDVHGLILRARCTTAGVGATLNYILLKAF